MVADAPRDDHHVADTRIGAADVAAGRQRAEGGGGNEDAVALARLDHLGVAGDDRDPASRLASAIEATMRASSASAKPSSSMKLAAR